MGYTATDLPVNFETQIKLNHQVSLNNYINYGH